MLKTIFNLPSKEEKERQLIDKIVELINKDDPEIVSDVKKKLSKLPQTVRYIEIKLISKIGRCPIFSLKR